MPPAHVVRTLDSDASFMLLLSVAKNNSGTVDWKAVGDSMDLSAMAAKARFDRLIKAQAQAGEGGAGPIAGMKAKASNMAKKARKLSKEGAEGGERAAKRRKVTGTKKDPVKVGKDGDEDENSEEAKTELGAEMDESA